MNPTEGHKYCCKFEVFGKVQGVYFRKHTQSKAKKLGLHGYVMNTSAGTVKGILEGDMKSIQDMQEWLKMVGSPASKIERASFTSLIKIDDFSKKSFVIKK